MSRVRKFQDDLIKAFGLEGRLVTKLVVTVEVDEIPTVEVTYGALDHDLSGMPTISKHRLKLVEDNA